MNYAMGIKTALNYVPRSDILRASVLGMVEASATLASIAPWLTILA